jgi:hypothetical protein
MMLMLVLIYMCTMIMYAECRKVMDDKHTLCSMCCHYVSSTLESRFSSYFWIIVRITSVKNRIVDQKTRLK